MAKKKTVNRAVRAREHAERLFKQRAENSALLRAEQKITLSIGSIVRIRPIGAPRRAGQSATPWQNKLAHIVKMERRHGYTVVLIKLITNSQAQIWLPFDEIVPHIPMPEKINNPPPALRKGWLDGNPTPPERLHQWLSDVR